MLSALIARFWWLSLTGKTVAVILVAYAAGALAGWLGFHDLARQLGSVALYVLGLLLTVLLIRRIWTSSTGGPGG